MVGTSLHSRGHCTVCFLIEATHSPFNFIWLFFRNLFQVVCRLPLSSAPPVVVGVPLRLEVPIERLVPIPLSRAIPPTLRCLRAVLCAPWSVVGASILLTRVPIVVGAPPGIGIRNLLPLIREKVLLHLFIGEDRPASRLVHGDLLENHFLIGGKETSPHSINQPFVGNRSLITVLINPVKEIRQ